MGQVSREYGFDVREPQRSDPMTPEDITSKLLYKLLKAGNQVTAVVRKRAPALTTGQLRGHLPDMAWGPRTAIAGSCTLTSTPPVMMK